MAGMGLRTVRSRAACAQCHRRRGVPAAQGAPPLPPNPYPGQGDFNHCNILVTIHYIMFNKRH